MSCFDQSGILTKSTLTTTNESILEKIMYNMKVFVWNLTLLNNLYLNF